MLLSFMCFNNLVQFEYGFETQQISQQKFVNTTVEVEVLASRASFLPRNITTWHFAARREDEKQDEESDCMEVYFAFQGDNACNGYCQRTL